MAQWSIPSQRRAAVDRIAQHVEHPPQHLIAHRHADAVSVRHDVHAARQIFAGCEHDAANRVAADLLGDFHHPLFAAGLDGQRFADVRQLSGFKFDVHHGTGDCDNFTDIHDSFPR